MWVGVRVVDHLDLTLTLTLTRRRAMVMTHTHAKGDLVERLEWIQRDGRTGGCDCITSRANAIGKIMGCQ